MKIGAIVQARLSSTRLPEKVLKELPFQSGITVLQQVIRRLKKSERISEIIIATTTNDEDQKIVNVADKEMVRWFRGSKDDVLERYYLSAKENKLDVIVRITSDCPCIDPEIADAVIGEHLTAKADFTSNVLVRTFPHGMDTEVFNFEVLEKTHQEARSNFDREHVCPYMFRSGANPLKIISYKASPGLYAPDLRITLDTQEDYALLCVVFDYLYSRDEIFKTKDIINLFKEKPWLKLINSKIVQKKAFETYEEEVEEAIRILDLQELKRVRQFLEESGKSIKK